MKNTHTPLYSHNLHHSYILFADTREAAALNSLYNIGFEYYPEVDAWVILQNGETLADVKGYLSQCPRPEGKSKTGGE